MQEHLSEDGSYFRETLEDLMHGFAKDESIFFMNAALNAIAHQSEGEEWEVERNVCRTIAEHLALCIEKIWTSSQGTAERQRKLRMLYHMVNCEPSISIILPERAYEEVEDSLDNPALFADIDLVWKNGDRKVALFFLKEAAESFYKQPAGQTDTEQAIHYREVAEQLSMAVSILKKRTGGLIAEFLLHRIYGTLGIALTVIPLNNESSKEHAHILQGRIMDLTFDDRLSEQMKAEDDVLPEVAQQILETINKQLRFIAGWIYRIFGWKH